MGLGCEPVTRVLVLGTNGMLGAMVARVLADHDELEVIASTRRGDNGSLAFDATLDSVSDLLDTASCQWIVNAIGMLDRDIDRDNPASVASALEVNAPFPNRLAASAGPGRRVVQIATDGVYSGQHSGYDERAPHDADGVYALTKTLGEVRAPNVMNLRCSIIGPEQSRGRSLLSWALTQPRGATITGYDNHWWNGITTLQFARLCSAVIRSGAGAMPNLSHVVPADSMTKADLLKKIVVAFGREDVTVVSAPAPTPADRRLATLDPAANRRLWELAGYSPPPTIRAMVGELAAFGR